MEILVVVVFVIGYLAIALEHPLRVNKTASALLAGVICWTLFVLSSPSESVTSSESFTSFVNILKLELGDKFSALTDTEVYREFVTFSLSEHLAEIAQILFFLMGAMTIVELVDAHHGFRFITDRIKTKNPKSLLWIICWVTFFLSSVLDNLTTTIVMLSLVRKLIPDKDMRLFFAGMIVIAANAGGAWTPIGDVTTTMLWIGGQITTGNIMVTLFLPSVACMLVPLIYLNFTLKGTLGEHHPHHHDKGNEHTVNSGKLMLVLGVGALVFVPIFKTLTHMPPYTGILLGLGILWVVSELINPDLDESLKKNYTVAGALARIDVPSVLFFLGILMAVGALESMQVLHHLATWLDKSVGDQRIIVTLIGLLSAVVDNVPLVAASMGMYSMDVFYQDHMVWEYLAYCAGTGGSILVIGSAAGVAAMGIEKIDFIWYVKKISALALLGYFAGAVIYLIIQPYLAVHPPH
jgi:Na+/H+ antiporter NhaD/arsenite permease-like protein